MTGAGRGDSAQRSTWLLEGLDGSALRIVDDALNIERPDGSVDKRVHLGRIRSGRVLAAGPEDDVFVYFGFTDPDIEIFGVRMDYVPFRYAVHPKRFSVALAMVQFIRERYLAYLRREDCRLSPPAGLEVDISDLRDQRDSLSEAVARVHGPAPTDQLIEWTKSILLDGEMVTELLTAESSEGEQYLFTATTDRILMTWPTALIAERPLAGLRWAEPGVVPTTLVLRDILIDEDFSVPNADEHDVVRVSAAIQRCIQLLGHVGSLMPETPDPIGLFEAWETIRERHALQMVGDEQASRELSGVLYTAIM